ncbi:MAG: helix-turn-helix domain-containing protein [Bryobacteraceae bacterium]
MNLSSTMERVLEERSRELILPPTEDSAPAPNSENAAANTEVPVADPPQTTQSQLRRQRRLERYQQVVDLFNAGHSKSAISRELGMERKTVRRWLRPGQFPERKPPHRQPSKVGEFADYLRQRWNEGFHNASRLYREIREKGYRGKRAMVARFVSRWPKSGMAAPKVPERIAPRHAAILVTRPADKISDEQQQLLDRFIQCPEVIVLRKLISLKRLKPG